MTVRLEKLAPILPSPGLKLGAGLHAGLGSAAACRDADDRLMKRDGAGVNVFRAPAIGTLPAGVAALGLSPDPRSRRFPPGGGRPRAGRAAVMPGPEGGPVGPGRVSPGRGG